MKPIFPLHAIDFYKPGHMSMYPEGTSEVYLNFCARQSKLFKGGFDFDNKVVAFGMQAMVQSLFVELWNEQFFSKSRDEVVARFKRRMDLALGEGAIGVSHVEALHDLGYLPLHIKALPEGSRVNIGVPVMTVRNTHPDFAWLAGYIETQLSAESWGPITTATAAYEFYRLFMHYAELTGAPKEFVPWQGHCFADRGMMGIAAASSLAGHSIPFFGTDSCGSLDHLENYYYASNTFIGGSVPATEHSVMCMGGADGEFGTFMTLIQDKFPKGVISVVSDTWDLWTVLTQYMPALKPIIMAREPDANGLAKVVIRPDSGDPVKIICGDPGAPEGSPARRGVIQLLWDTFGGTVSSTGHLMLDPHVGMIYGDAITMDRAKEILKRLADQGFASSNVVLGIGSFTYQYTTRDTFSFAYKATWGVVNGEERELFKDPITDDGTKKSARGLLRVEKEGDNFVLYDQQTRGQEEAGILQTIFLNGVQDSFQTLGVIRARLLGA